MSNLEASYKLILKELRKISEKENLYFKPIKPKLSDIELISLIILSEFKSIDSEHQLFREIKGFEIESKIERSVYNRRKRKLFPFIEEIRMKMVKKFNEFENYFVVDSMPLEVCKITRSSRSKICKEVDYAIPNKGFCASQNLHFYGYKLHAVCSISGVFQSFDLSPASVHDIHYLQDIRKQMSDCVLLGDKGYLSQTIQLDLFNQVNIQLETPKRKNQKGYKPQFYHFKKYRKRIETLFSQLCDQFMIRRNYAKTFEGFKTRILAKITTLTTIQYLNKFVFNRNINNLKINLV
ncbi:IS982 family transposase [Flavobacterium sp. CBA20B-1]|uniref:IS982 family transposase n=1 Tax=unclassified Flavobacterium TaxID=196869 RepID=UPI002223FF44|nr:MULTISPECIES: IS982 family transposase [unclassified Flavobacterium]WCM42226.1 IS982 family transposase [Flavobacterium sp. CBA20B-1]WCM43138.1 IS982 family transposase [Flavobacterium sp. CBA20B-1]